MAQNARPSPKSFEKLRMAIPVPEAISWHQARAAWDLWIPFDCPLYWFRKAGSARGVFLLGSDSGCCNVVAAFWDSAGAATASTTALTSLVQGVAVAD
eukprot:CAMPEP_0182936362 /NCGR_PEP_ID=MMETSP0105_2-20130417/40097_1 /TAXON_ID=81532 ORGANISM="Acanthoeca-like sp., Strain 10tr" /NCGR_SAMPLE_ID=MMETSP0105_2 /ASSEMBLY_ACC=CAM_ASM_000205 /LENGTH=97 /DNA_ID=CAMNT_0025075449 /DNA_START=162 /DNA_END=455 /DNA_ORIENTATION=+